MFFAYPLIGFPLIQTMPKILHTTEDILEDGTCPVCDFPGGQWTPYNNPENKELGTFCSGCDTHFIDIDGSKEEYEGW